MTYKERMQYLIEKSGKQQKDICKDLNYTTPTFSRRVNGINLPKTDEIIQFAKYFCVSTDYILGLSDTPGPYESRTGPLSEEEEDVIMIYRNDPSVFLDLMKAFQKLDKSKQLIILGKCHEFIEGVSWGNENDNGNSGNALPSNGTEGNKTKHSVAAESAVL